MKTKPLLIALSLTAFAFMSKSCINEQKKSDQTEEQTTAIEEEKQEEAAT